MDITLCSSDTTGKCKRSSPRNIAYYSNINSHLSRSITPSSLDPHIPAFKTDEKGLSQKHTDDTAYESMDATGNIALQATPAYNYQFFIENRHNDNQNSNAAHMNNVTHKVVNTTCNLSRMTHLQL